MYNKHVLKFVKMKKHKKNQLIENITVLTVKPRYSVVCIDNF